MTDKEIILKKFIDHFILKDKRERSFFELTHPKKRNKFTDRLNHNWDAVLNMKHLTKIEKQFDDAASIQRLLKFEDTELCYVISNYSGFDDRIMPFGEVFPEIYSYGFATILINLPADTLFLDTEQEQGPADRFIGRIKTY